MRLSVEQAAAAGRLDGATRVVAGAGTGKTAVIAERFRRLVKRGTSPAEVLVMTFSDRAAREMRGRIEQAIGEPPPSVGTFHALAMGWLREEGRAVAVAPTFRVLAGADRWIALRELMWELGDPELVGEERPDDLVTPLLKVEERLEQELVPLHRLQEWCAENPTDERAPALAAAARLFVEHARRNRAAGRLDFDDVLAAAVRLLESPGSAADRLRARYRHVMVDEYQDTNLAQERIVELLGRRAESVFVVGDDDQSIYRFRGAALASMNRFLRVFPEAETVKLGANRRSTRAIVDSAAALIRCNPDRIDKDLRAVGAVGGRLTILEAATGGDEAAAIVESIERLLAAGTAPSEIAVLCRTHALGRPILDQLRARAIPHRQVGGGILDVAEVRDVIAMLRLLADPGDVHAAARIVQRPPVEGPLEEALAAIRRQPDRSALETLACWRPAHRPAADLLDLSRLSASAGIGDLFFELMARTRLLEVHRHDSRAVAAVTRFGEVVDEFATGARDQSLAAFLGRLDLVLLSGQDEEFGEADAEAEAVRVMTIHQAKGLEFDAVFVPGLVEGRLPQPARRSGFDLPAAILEPAVRRREDHLAEERRLTYVALTRARWTASLSLAATYDGAKVWAPSRFLGEVDAGGRCDRVVAAAAEPQPAERVEREPMPGERSFSFSSLAAYRECPAQHRYRYVLGLPAPVTVEGQYGSVVHSALMALGRMRQVGRRPDAADVDAALDAEWSRVDAVDVRRLPALRRLGSAQLRRFVEDGGFADAPARLEERFVADVDGWRLEGVIDRLDAPVDEAAPWRIVDYKTGSPLPKSRLRRDLQLALYALGARQALGLASADLEIVYLKSGKRVTVPASDELLAEARATASEAVGGIRAGDFEPRPERRRCSLCSYRLACPAAL